MKSMTGFGSAVVKQKSRTLSIEVKSVNHKFCEINVRMPQKYLLLENKVIQEAKDFFKRGRIDIFFREEIDQQNKSRVRLDEKQLKDYLKQIKDIRKKYHIKEEIPFADLLHLPNIIINEEEFDLEEYWPKIKKSLQEAFKELEAMRIKEGSLLQKKYREYLKDFAAFSQKIQKLIPENIKAYKQKISDRLTKMLGDQPLDPDRLYQEIVIFVDRSDVSEEIVRLNSHVKHFNDILKEQVPIGRRLDFLLQEMNREVNTLSSKSNSALISQVSVQMKQLIEKMREQIQNVE